MEQEDGHAAMMTSSLGKAVLLVKEIIAIVKETNDANPDWKRHKIKSVSYDDMVHFAEQMLGLQIEFGESKRPTKVDVGYHYTHEANLPRSEPTGC